jgi:hypothetical protein
MDPRSRRVNKRLEMILASIIMAPLLAVVLILLAVGVIFEFFERHYAR